jgi:hypothetical protein
MKAAGNLEVVKGVVGASARGDFSDASWADPGIEFVVDDSLSRETWSGIANLGEGWLTFFSSWEEYRVKSADVRELVAVTGSREPRPSGHCSGSVRAVAADSSVWGR